MWPDPDGEFQMTRGVPDAASIEHSQQGQPVGAVPPEACLPGQITTSVIVPAFNAESTLPACLEALAANGVPGPCVELIVVDDGSTDQTEWVATRPNVRVVKGAGRGPAVARNLGARIAWGQTLVFLDADTAPQPGWLEAMSSPFHSREVAAVKGRYVTNQRSLVARFCQLEFEEKYARLQRAKHVDFVDSGTAAYRREYFEAVGGFDEGFGVPSAEDIDLSFRLAATGAILVFKPDATVRHHHAESILVYLMKKGRYGFYRVRVYRRFPGKALGDSYTPPLMAAQIALSGLVAASGALAGLRIAPARFVFALSALAFLATTVPLSKRAMRSDRSVVAIAPGMIFLRSFAQGTGILAGICAQLFRGGAAFK